MGPGRQRRRPIATLALAPAGCVLLGGRVLALSGDRLRLADSSGVVELIRPAGSTVAAGDLVEVEVELDEPPSRELLAGALRVVARYQAPAPFPSPGGEYYRLHQDRPARLERLTARAAALRATRAFLDGRGYLEVQTPQLVRSPGLEPHLRALPAADGYLITSPEYQMKRLLAGGLEQIYFLGTCWRGDETGLQHLREFCMLEWYRAFSGIGEMMEETEQLVASLAVALRGTTRLSFRGRTLDLEPPFQRLTLAEAFRRHAGLELRGVASTEELRGRAEQVGLGPFSEADGFEAIASRALVERVEPALAEEPRPVLLHDFPAPLAALSRLSPGDPTVAERFELYAGGLELCNAFGELTDPVEQRRRFLDDQRARMAAGATVYPLDERFLLALAEGMPPAAGNALGVDRLLMLVLDAADIREVVAFAGEEV